MGTLIFSFLTGNKSRPQFKRNLTYIPGFFSGIFFLFQIGIYSWKKNHWSPNTREAYWPCSQRDLWGGWGSIYVRTGHGTPLMSSWPPVAVARTNICVPAGNLRGGGLCEWWCLFAFDVMRYNNNNNKRPLTPKSMPPAGDEHAKLKTYYYYYYYNRLIVH